MRWSRAIPLVALVAAVVVGLAAPAGAHAAYKSSDPPDDGQVSSPPSEVTATFTEPLAGGSFLQVTDPCGVRVDNGDVRIVGYDMSVSMDGAAAGRYTVFYKAHSSLDPHVTEGTFGFTATAGDGCAGEERPSAAAPQGGGSNPGGSASAADDGSEGAAGPAAAAGATAGPNRATGGRARSGSGPGAGTFRNPAAGTQGRERPGDDESAFAAAESEEAAAPSVWDGIRLEPFLTGLLLAAIIGAAGGKMYAGIMGPRA